MRKFSLATAIATLAILLASIGGIADGWPSVG
jgi:hypothetical protein